MLTVSWIIQDTVLSYRKLSACTARQPLIATIVSHKYYTFCRLGCDPVMGTIVCFHPPFEQFTILVFMMKRNPFWRHHLIYPTRHANFRYCAPSKPNLFAPRMPRLCCSIMMHNLSLLHPLLPIFFCSMHAYLCRLPHTLPQACSLFFRHACLIFMCLQACPILFRDARPVFRVVALLIAPLSWIIQDTVSCGVTSAMGSDELGNGVSLFGFFKLLTIC